MATVGSITLAVLRSDLRARINEITTNTFDDLELTRWLNVAQQETAIRIKDFNESWYLAPKQITINVADNAAYSIDLSGSNYFSTDWAKVYELHYVKANTYLYGNTGTLPIVPISHMSDYSNSTMHSGYSKVAQVGSNLYFTNELKTSDIFQIFYYRNPVDMSTDASTLDVPNWTQDLVIMFAYGICLRRLGKNTEENDAMINRRMEQIKQMFGMDMQMDVQKKKEGTVK